MSDIPFCRCHTADHPASIKEELAAQMRKLKATFDIKTVMDHNRMAAAPNVNINESITIPVVFHLLCPVSNTNDGTGIDPDTDLDIFINTLNDAYTVSPSKIKYYDLSVDQLASQVFGGNHSYASQYHDYVHNRPHPCPITFVKSKVINTGAQISTTMDADQTVKINGSPVQYVDGYPHARALNIWFVTFTDGTLGYAQFPSDQKTKPATDGVVIHWTTIKPGYHGGMSQYTGNKTAVHEIGHWLGLYHVFQSTIGGNDPMAIDYEGKNDSLETQGDDVVDTPPQSTPTYGNPFTSQQWPTYHHNLSMFMNYMDYVDDDAMFMFTHDQVLKIMMFIHMFRS